MKRQVRIQGAAARVSDAEADAYYASRPRGSQIGAWASDQSTHLDKRETLEERVLALATKYEGQPVPRPSHWTGYRVAPSRIEFWQGRKSRLHDRFLYTRLPGGSWEMARLYP